MQLANFIIGGTEKSGTTSVFSYLSEHPEVISSRRKETNFFRTPNRTPKEYAACFPQQPKRKVVMEASPAYLGEADAVSPRIRSMLPDAKLLFILREPGARFLSSYSFHRARLNLPESLSFREYLDMCLTYAKAVLNECNPEVAAKQLPLDEWYLQVLLFGCYARYLEKYFELFPRENISVMFYDDLCADPQAFMKDLSVFLGIDATCWANANLEAKNVTFAGRSKVLHRGALFVNDLLEPILRGAPRAKSAIMYLYKRVNQARQGYDGMSDQDRAELAKFYQPHNLQLQNLLDVNLPATTWTLPEIASNPTVKAHH